MVLKSDQERIKALLKDTITLLCRNGLTFKTEFSIEALIGITLDQDDVLLVNINEIVRNELGHKLAAEAQDSNSQGNELGVGSGDWDDNYSDTASQHSMTPSSNSKRKRKRRKSAGQGSKGDQESDDGGGSDGGESYAGPGDDPSTLSEPLAKRNSMSTSRTKSAVKQEDDDSKDIVFIKEEVDSGDWASTSQGQEGFPGDLSGIPSSSNSTLNPAHQESFDFLQGNSLIPMGGTPQQNANLWSDMTGRQNITSPSTKRTSTVTSAGSAGPSLADDSQQIQFGSSVRTDETLRDLDGNVSRQDQAWETEIKTEVDSPPTFEMNLESLSSEPETPTEDFPTVESSVNSQSRPPTEPTVESSFPTVSIMPPPFPGSLAPMTPLTSKIVPQIRPVYGIPRPSGAGPNEKQFRLSVSGQLGQVCPMCSKVLTSPRGFKLHVDAHKGIFPLHCQYCQRGFLSNSALRGHLVSHTNKKEFKCRYCGKEFKYRNGLDYHHAFCQARYKEPSDD